MPQPEQLLINPTLSPSARDTRSTRPTVPGATEVLPGWWLVPSRAGTNPGTVTAQRGYVRLSGDVGTRLVQVLAEPVSGPRMTALVRVVSGAIDAGAVWEDHDSRTDRIVPSTGVGTVQDWQPIDRPASGVVDQVALYCAADATVVDIEIVSLLSSVTAPAEAAAGSAPGDQLARAPANRTAALPVPPVGDGGGGGGTGSNLAVLTIQSVRAAGGNSVEPGATEFEVQVGVLPRNVDVTTVSIDCQGHTYSTSRPDAGRLHDYTVLVRVYHPGTVTLTARVKGVTDFGGSSPLNGSPRSDEFPPITMPVTFTTNALDVTALTPPQDQRYPITDPNAPYRLSVRAQTSFDQANRSVTASLDRDPAHAPVRLNLDPSTGIATGDVLVSIPIGPRTMTLTCTDVAGNTGTTTVTLTMFDGPPTLSVAQDATLKQVSFVEVGDAFTTTITGSALDRITGLVGGTVQWTLDPTTGWQNATTTDNWAHWTFDLSLPIGTHTLNIRATGPQGNTTATAYPLRILGDYVPTTVDDRLSERAYLQDLLDFIMYETSPDHRSGGEDTTNLETLLSQPFAVLAAPESFTAAAGSDPVSAARVSAEILRARLKVLPLTPQARWTFDPSTIQGPTASEVLVAGPNATLGGTASIGSGRNGGQAVVVSAATDVVTIPHGPTIDLGNTTGQFTVAFWLQLTADVAPDYRVIIHKGDTDHDRILGVWVAPNSQSLYVRTATSVSGDVGIALSAPLTRNAWTHITITNAGDELRLYLDGNLDTRAKLTGSLRANTGALRLGFDGTTEPAPCLVGDLRIFPVALSANSVAALPAEATPKSVRPLPTRRDSAVALYQQRTYDTLLAAAGTSYDELRLLRGAGDAARTALAERLGIALSPGATDELTQLTIPTAALTEAAMETLFGLPDTTNAAIRAIPPALLLTWRMADAARRWSTEDHSGTGPIPLLLDPDIVSAADLATTPAGAAAVAILATRAGQLAGFRTSLSPPTPSTAANLAGVLSAGLGAGVDLDDLQTHLKEGTDISGALAAVGLSRNAFDRLQALRQIAVSNPLEDLQIDEWSDALDILTQCEKSRLVAPWQTDEAGITLEPDLFVTGAQAPPASPWRQSSAIRAAWQKRLAARTAERQTILDGQATIVSATEGQTMPQLRDALLAGAVDSSAITDVAAYLTANLGLDIRAGSVLTTRVRQAADTLRAILSEQRTGDLPLGHPAYRWTLADIAVVWSWLGDYGTWRQTRLVDLFCENNLDPSLQAAHSAAFSAAITATRQLAPLAPADARTIAAAFLKDNPTAGGLTQYMGAGTLTDTDRSTFAAASVTVLGKDPGDRAALWPWTPAAHDALEVFYGLPVVLGLRLHAAGQFAAALDHFRLVYAYDKPRAQRMVGGWPWPDPAVTRFGSAAIALEYVGRFALNWPTDWTTAANPHEIAKTRPNPYTRFVMLSIATCLTDYGDTLFANDTADSLLEAGALYQRAIDLLDDVAFIPQRPTDVGEPALPNPTVIALRTRCNSQLAKLRGGYTLTGLPRTSDPAVGAGGAISPSPYRYQALIDRARRLVAQAQQIEAAYLSALANRDDHQLLEDDARRQAGLIKLQSTAARDRVAEMQDGVDVATSQQQKATAMSNLYQQQLNNVPDQYEKDLLASYPTLATLQGLGSGLQAAGNALSASSASAGGAFLSAGVSVALSTGAAILYGAQAANAAVIDGLQAQMQANQLMSAMEQRQATWTIDKANSDADATVAAKQVVVAQSQVTVAQADQAVADQQVKDAQAHLLTLTTQFTNAAFYDWLQGVLAGLLRYFLQQATVTAKLAQNELAFERAINDPGIIADQYWQSPSDSTDRQGISSAERLTADIEQLDTVSFSTDQRMLNVSLNFSLSQLMPVEFLAFQRTGQLTFSTPMALFDNAFPGQFHRQIHDVRVSVIALIPPSVGIRSTLAATGISRIVVQNDLGFTPVTVRRSPATIAFTSPLNADGRFGVDLQPELLLPFEGSGVDTTWEFELLPQANAIDFTAIADVLLTVDYTALFSASYRSTVVQALNTDLSQSADRVFSLAQDFPDQWWDLNNTLNDDGSADVTLTLRAVDFPNRVLAGTLTTAQITMMLVGSTSPVGLSLHRDVVVDGTTSTLGGDATTIDGIASTRRGNAPAWWALGPDGPAPAGDWALHLSPDATTQLSTGQVSDILFVLTWSGQTAPWPP